MAENQVAVALKQKGIKVADFARQTGINQQTLYNVVKKDTVDNIGISTFMKIAHGLGMTAEELYYGTPPKPPTFSDPQQTALNGYYECMNDTGRKLALDSVKAMSSSVELRMEKNVAERPADQTAMGA